MSPAQTVERFSLSADAVAGVSGNPFLGRGTSQASSYVEIGLAPSFTVAEERGSASLQGSFRATEYLQRFGSSYAYNVTLGAERRMSEEFTLRAQGATESSVVGERGADPLDLAPPGTPAGEGTVGGDPGDSLLDLLDPDLGLLGERTRRNRLSAELGLDYQPFPEDRLGLTLQAARNSFPGSELAVSSNTLSGNFSYSRSLGVAGSIGMSASVSQNRTGGRSGSSTIYRPQVTYSRSFFPAWQLTLGVGASFLDEGPVLARRSSTLSGDINACRSGVRLRLCLSGSRGFEQNATGSVGENSSVSGQLSYLLSERETLGVSGVLGQVSQSSGLADDDGGGDVRQQSLAANYQLRLRERWNLGLTASYRGVDRPGRPIEPDFAATASVRVGLER